MEGGFRVSKILLLEDDLSLINGLSFALKKAGYDLDIARTIQEALGIWQEGQYDLLVLDEFMSAYNHGLIEQKRALDFLLRRPEHLEIVLTGRNPAPELSAFADYITAMEKKKHPFDDGVPARQGIEW